MSYFDQVLSVNRKGKTRFCENGSCEAEATTRVPVSLERTGDAVRYFCDLCAEAYTIGVQHGSFRTRTELKKEMAAKRAAKGHRDARK